MSISVFKLFKVGLGPSSSHTMGPMTAAGIFLGQLAKAPQGLEGIDRVVVELYGSLALTGVGHGTDKAVILGLLGEKADLIDPDTIDPSLDRVSSSKKILLDGQAQVDFDPKKHIIFFKRKSLKAHPNGMKFKGYRGGECVLTKTFYSIGGGFVVDECDVDTDQIVQETTQVSLPFLSGKELLEVCSREGMSIAEVMRNNERSWRTDEGVEQGLLNIWKVMEACIDRGCSKEGILPGGLKVKRRAAAIFKDLSGRPEVGLTDPLTIMDWVNLYALAGNEENASGSRVVTAPTNGAAGIIPAVLKYYKTFCRNSSDQGVVDFLLSAGAVGLLYLENASISGAEVGCQGEVGVACSMAAAGLTAVLGGTPGQVEQAAEIGMEHNLGLTCDPIGGLVQIPCIERNVFASERALGAECHGSHQGYQRISYRSEGHWRALC